jgi:hypothetical protein
VWINEIFTTFFVIKETKKKKRCFGYGIDPTYPGELSAKPEKKN